jgi:hypothetical protein
MQAGSRAASSGLSRTILQKTTDRAMEFLLNRPGLKVTATIHSVFHSYYGNSPPGFPSAASTEFFVANNAS